MYKNHNCIPTVLEINALCKYNDFSRSLGTSMIHFFFFFYKMTPVLLQGAVWGYASLCAKGQRVYVMVRCPSCVRPCINFFLKYLL